MNLRIITLAAGITATLWPAAPALRAEEVLNLSLEECYQRAMNNNLGLHASRLGLRYSYLGPEAAMAPFDPTLSFRLNRSESNSPNYTSYIPVDAIEQSQSSANFTIGQTISTGGVWGFGAYSSLSESNVERIKNYSSYLGFSLEQPLLRGWGRSVTHSSIYLARLSGNASLSTVEEQAVNLLAQVEAAYWNLVYERATLAVREMAHAQAESLLVYNEAGRDLGVLVESDVLEAKSAFLARQQEVLEQLNAIRIAEDELKLLLNLTGTGPDDLLVVPTESPSVPDEDLDVSTALETALISRPDYHRLGTEIEQQKIRLAVARNAVLPELDVNASYRVNGSGGTFDRNLRRIGDVDAYGWTVGLNLSYPLNNRSAKIEYERRDIELKRSQVNRESLRNEIETDIRACVRNVGTNRERIDVARMAVEANEMKLRMEEEKFRNNLSTSYLVLQYQTDLANARSRYNRALVDYMLSILEFRRAKGTLLRDLDIRIVPLEQ